jgi:transcriptional regulator with XRE-family HTH domain
MISIAQIRGARGLLGWSQQKLATEAGLSLPTIKRLEAQGTIRVSDDVRHAVRHAFESAGIRFIDENGGGPGVRLTKGKRSKNSRRE